MELSWTGGDCVWITPSLSAPIHPPRGFTWEGQPEVVEMRKVMIRIETEIETEIGTGTGIGTGIGTAMTVATIVVMTRAMVEIMVAGDMVSCHPV
jgi:hypothetical protein